MKRITCIGMMVLFGLAARAAEAPGWGSDVTNALQNARTEKRPVLMEFNAPWCPYCRQMENKTFKDDQVAGLLKQFERVAVNIDQNAALAAQHGVRGIPAFVMLDSDGEELAKTTGFMDASQFNRWLTEGITNLTASTAQKREFKASSREVDAALGSDDPDARVKGVGTVLDWCERREKIYREFGLEKLQALSRTEPGLLLEGLNHPSLMARIRVANLLRDRLGVEFNVDPWEKAEVRAQGIQSWKTRLEAKQGIMTNDQGPIPKE